MSQVTMLTYAIAMTAANAEKIDAMNRIILGAEYTAASGNQLSDAQKAGAASIPAQEKAANETDAEVSLTLADIKNAAKKAKKDHGEEFTTGVLDDLGVKKAASLGRRMSAITEDQYTQVVELWAAGPKADDLDDDDGLDDDGLDDDGLDEEMEVPSVDSVKTALRAYVKSPEGGRDAAKKLMSDNGAASLSKIDDCTPEQLVAIFKGTL